MTETTAPGRAAANGVREVKSAARTIEVLELLAERGTAPVTIRDLCERMGAPRSSVYALLRTLVDAGWVRTDPLNTEYSIGIRALLAGTTYLDADATLAVVRPVLAEVGQDLNATVNFGRLDGSDVVYLATWEAPGRERSAPRVGRRLPAHATAIGQAVLSTLPDPAALGARPLERLTAQTVTDPAELRRILQVTRERGYAREDGQNNPEIACVAVPMPDTTPAERPLDGLSVSFRAASLTAAREREAALVLREAARRILDGLR
ncbi:IclR family transcriptional regulator [Citricoccus sp. I39-566]|uniref:IclR family transcriptional regulator n=1 Tax=Citricoccus sp. I39-566 TaxID=3073268 RepID=UPI00286CB656|nr:IclR family transcriptional regulator [Citricoccus sp. I39-566]WMY77935.1 IclR family transcriptional regulator [Citricoccus sp. I39-566]